MQTIKKILCLILAVLSAALYMIGCAKADEGALTSSQPISVFSQEESKKEWYDGGTYLVGEDVPAGLYYVESTDYECYMQISEDGEITQDSILTGEFFRTHSYVEVSDGKFLTVNGGRFILEEYVAPARPIDSILDEGTYYIGKDLPAGEYEIISYDSLCRYEVSNSAAGLLSDIVESGNNIQVYESVYVTVAEGQFLKVYGGQIILS